MDVDAVLARRPQVALVDELAHTNVPGSPRPKRWQDVELLLEAGIDVISTVNIQHLESVNDVVEAITGIRQRETVPDSVVRAADQVELRLGGHRRGRGRGAAPGVGKTFAMLDEGYRRAGRGTDVVVGYVETHNRPRTAARLADLEVLPRRQLTYRGASFTEMDV